MSAQDRLAEQEVADFYDSIRPAPKPREGRRTKRFFEGFFSGIAVAQVARKILQ